MKFLQIVTLAIAASTLNLWAFDVQKLANDKELTSNFIHSEKLAQARQEAAKVETAQLSFKQLYQRVLSDSFKKVTDNPQTCGLRLISEMRSSLYRQGMGHGVGHFENWLHLARHENIIDDLLANMLSDYNLLENRIRYYSARPAYPKQIRMKYLIHDKAALKELYQTMESSWADGKNNCVIGQWRRLAESVRRAFNVRSENLDFLHKVLISTNLHAYNLGIISRVTWNRLEVLRFNSTLYQKLTLSKYLDNLLNAKDILTSELAHMRGDTSVQHASTRTKRYLSHSLRRYEQLTRRKKLYQKYSSQQILILSDIIVKASKRMNAFKSEIHIDYQDDEDEQPDEIYVISPMEQYRMSLKMLKKDYANISLSSLFNGVTVDYEDIVMASLETGVIGFDELDYVVQYEDFWTPKRETTWQKIRGFLFSFAGSASFFLPTPFNVIGAVGLVYTQTLLFKKNQEVDASNNANSIF